MGIWNYTKKYQGIIKWTVSTVLLFIIFQQLDFGRLLSVLKSFSFPWFVPYVIILVLNVFIASFKWWKILSFENFQYKFFSVLKLFWIGMFYNQFLPGRIGGDAVKMFYLAQNEESRKAGASGSVVIDRLYNLIGLLLIAFVGLFFCKVQVELLILPVLLFGFFLIMLLLVIVGIEPVLEKTNLLRFPLFKKVNHIVKAFKPYLCSWKRNIFMVTWGILYQFSSILGAYFLGRSLHIDLSLDYYIVFVPMVVIITMLPFTIGGLGIREGGYLVFFTRVGVGSETAIGFSLFGYFMLLLLSLPGYFFPWGDKGQKKGSLSKGKK
jgi:hypothetical protein